jgi:hypothetical protein
MLMVHMVQYPFTQVSWTSLIHSLSCLS